MQQRASAELYSGGIPSTYEFEVHACAQLCVYVHAHMCAPCKMSTGRMPVIAYYGKLTPYHEAHVTVSDDVN